MAFSKLTTTPNIAGAKGSEHDKIIAMMHQSNEGFDHTQYQKTTRAPPNYLCYRCGGKGHFVRYCPTQGDPRYNQKQMRAPSGIPREYYLYKMKKEEEILQSLRSAQPAHHFTPTVSSEIVDQSKVPGDLQCSICSQLFKDAVVTPCCGVSYCDDCIRTHLVDNSLVCKCGETTSPDNLIGNRSLRTSVNNFRNQKPVEMKSVSMTQPDPSQTNGSPAHIKEEPIDPSHLPTEDMSTGVSANGLAMSSVNVPSPAIPDDVSSSIESPQRVIEHPTPQQQHPQHVVMEKNGPAVVSATPLNLAITVSSTSLPSSHVPYQLPSSMQHIVNPPAHFSGSSGPAIYTNVQGTARPAFPSVMGAPTIVQQPGIVQLGFPAGAQFVRQRFVPVNVQAAVPRFIAQPQIQIAAPQPQPLNQVPRGSTMDMNHQHLVSNPGAIPQHQQQIPPGHVSKGPGLPLSEEDFYKWQMQLKNRPPRNRSRSRSRSPGEKRSRRRRYRSISPNDGKKGRYDSPADDSSQERKQSSRRKKDKMKRRHRGDSSQDESMKGPDMLLKSSRSSGRCGASGGVGASGMDKKNKRRIPDHIKREVDEFDFDNELEFDEELRRLNHKKGEGEKLFVVAGEADTCSRSPSYDKNSVTADAKPETPIEKGDHDQKVTDSNDKLEVGDNSSTNNNKNEKTWGESENKQTAEPEVLEHMEVTNVATSEMHNAEEALAEKPKRKTTKIVKKKIIRVIKRKRGSSGQIISQTIIHRTADENDEEEGADENNVKKDEKKKEPTNDSSSKKPRVSCEIESPSRRSTLKLTPEKKKERLRKRPVENSPMEAKQLLAQVQAKKEAEKQKLLHSVSAEKERKKRQIEKYLLLKKKAKERAIVERRKLASSRSSGDNTEESKLPNDSTKHEKKATNSADKEKKRPDQNLYKLGDAKLKSISDASKKQLKESEERQNSAETSSSSSRAKPRRKKEGGASDDDASSQSSDHEKNSRHLAKSSSTNKHPASLKSDNRRDRNDARERDREREKRHKEEEELRRREVEYERELREKKRLYKLQKEKDEMVERERQTMKEKEKLERKLEKERELRKEMEREKYEELERRHNRKKDEERRDKRRVLASTTSERDTEDDNRNKRSSKKNKTGYVIQILDSEKERSGDESSSESSQHQATDKKKKKKGKKKKDKKKKKKREQQEESDDDSENESTDEDEEETKSKKKKRKHKKKHKKHSKKSKKHKKKSKKKKKKKEEESEDEDEDDDDDDDDDTPQDENKESNEEEEDGSESDTESKEGSGEGESKEVSGEEASSSNSSPARDDGDGRVKENESELSSNEQQDERKEKEPKKDLVEKKEKDGQSARKAQDCGGPASSKAKTKENSVAVGDTDRSLLKTAASFERVKRPRSTLGGEEDLELDYLDDDVTVGEDDTLLYGFGDDEQTSSLGKDEKPNGRKTMEFEEGEISDSELFAPVTKTINEKEPVVELSEVTNTDDAPTEVETTTVDDDTEIDDAIDNAMNIEGLLGDANDCDSPAVVDNDSGAE